MPVRLKVFICDSQQRPVGHFHALCFCMSSVDCQSPSCLLFPTFIPTAPSNVFVLPVLGVVDDSLALDVAVEAVVGGHARRGQVCGELSVEAVQDGALRRHLRGLSAHVLRTRLVDDVRVVLNYVCTE